MRRNSYMIHGHQHLKGDQRFGNGKRMDIGMCGHPEFRPYHLDEIVDLLKDLESYEVENRVKGGSLIR
jgi:calcineurin-like phosphoesterase family protein